MGMSAPDKLLTLVNKEFGADNPEEWRTLLEGEFVRSQDHLATASKKSTGRRLTAWQVAQAFGVKKNCGSSSIRNSYFSF
jgi:hypothetical protein